MPNTFKIYRSQTLRLSHHDYGDVGAYFITFCTHQKAPLFGTIKNGIVRLSPAGCLAWSAWRETAQLRPNISLGAFIAMPNHIHGIVHINEKRSKPNSNTFEGPSQTLGAIVRGYKCQVTSRMRRQLGYPNTRPVWQNNYYEHIIRNPRAYQYIEQYIVNTPLTWHKDTLRS